MVRCSGVMLILGIASRAGGQQLAPQELAQAIALGQGCQAPIIRLSSSRGDFEMFVESPFATAALVSATARMMHQPLDAPRVKQAMRPGYRVWTAIRRRTGILFSLSRRRIAVGAPQARPPERSGATGPRARRREGSAG